MNSLNFLATEQGFAQTFYEYEDEYISETEDPNRSSHSETSDPSPVTDIGLDSHYNVESESETFGFPNWSAGNLDSLTRKVTAVLTFMNGINITPFEWLDAFSWGTAECSSNPDIKAARTAFMHNPSLLAMLRRWWRPPRVRSSKPPPTAAQDALITLFREHVIKDIMDKELEALEPWFRGDSDLALGEQSLQTFKLHPLIVQVKEIAPTLSMCLDHLSRSARQRAENSHKSSDIPILIIISILSYSRSHARNRLQKLFAIYFKFHGTTAKAQDMLHALGLTMSHKWTCNAVGDLSQHAIKNMLLEITKFPYFLSEDNAIIPSRVFSQTLDNQGSLGNSTAATIYINKKATPLSADANERLRLQRANGILNPIGAADILQLGLASGAKLFPFYVYQVLQVLIRVPEFEFESYSRRRHRIFTPPTPIHQLPHGKDHITQQFLLGTVPFPEASFEDHLKLIREWSKQLGTDSAEERRKTATSRVMVWCGDQLTVDRLRGLFRYRSGDSNSYERLDWMVLSFGWFHLMMAFANSLYKQYLGTAKGQGLKKAINLLRRKGLANISTQGIFHQTLDDLLHHVAEAHLRVDWLRVAKAQSFADLRNKSPEELLDLAKKLIEQCASSTALSSMDSRVEYQDEAQRSTIQFNRDMLSYLSLGTAIRTGDVGVMETMIPNLIFRFSGGGSKRYTLEMLEALQQLQKELPLDVATFLKENCWLVNFSGKPDGFLPVDRAQEHNIKDIKVTHRPEGPSIDWKYLQKLHPAIPVIRSISDLIEEEFSLLARGKSHSSPSVERDIQELQNTIIESTYHEYKKGRKLDKGNKVKDYVMDGIQNIIHKPGPLANWKDNRTFDRSFKECWENEGEISD
ncbi:hypothetical protein K435DRAFT_961970 [Dendrothele bispora CBS 962.96]|uniref:DUF6589 domain-containing protein n=1 Tax=Dendrothele bispora (strain CBS 962.96) TaxID=1314807 RepID=A0A4S8MPZ2_DENBC|nr:hypothetical protein K435DRAFT_961970 [Dendrothele bispora CBS 962.96]